VRTLEVRAISFKRLAAVVVLTLLACLGKESGVMTGAFILLIWFCLRPMKNRSVLAAGIAALAAAVLYMALRLLVMEGALQQVPPHGGDRLTGALYGGYGCFYQIGLVFRPWFHNLDFQDGFFDDLMLPTAAAGAGLYLAILAAGLALVRRAPLAACAVFVFAAAQLPSSSIIVPLRSLVNDRYLYVPMAGAALFAAALLYGLERRAAARWISRGAAAALLVLLAFCTHGRSADWTDGKTLWRAAIDTHPGSIRARVGLSKALLAEAMIAESTEEAVRLAEEALRTAVEGFDLGRPGTAVRMNAMYKAAEALAFLQRFEQSENLLERLLAEARAPDRAENFRLFEKACFDLWALEIRGGRFDEAVSTVEMMIDFLGESPLRLDLLGMTLLDAGRPGDAEAAFRRGAALPGDFADIHYHLADLLERTGRPEEAERERARGRTKEKDAPR
jgi:tetratricopeptide (TPR) repeat protein